MDSNAFTLAVHKMADEAGLRRIVSRLRKDQKWIGIHSGIMIMMHLDSVRLYAEFTSPEPETVPESTNSLPEEKHSTSGQVERKPAEEAFRQTKAAGIPANWFDQNKEGAWGFQLIIDESRRRSLTCDNFSGLLDCIAADLHELGAEPFQPCCECKSPANILAYVESMSTNPLLAPYCTNCWQLLHEETRGQIMKAPPTRLWRAWAFLVAGVICMSAIWGYAQHPGHRVPIHLLIGGCGAAGVALAMATMWVANGSSLTLRLGVVAGVMIATLAGNIVGIKLLMEANGRKTSWFDVVPGYFVDYFPLHVGQELLFLLGGVIGVLIGFYLMRESERIRIR